MLGGNTACTLMLWWCPSMSLCISFVTVRISNRNPFLSLRAGLRVENAGEFIGERLRQGLHDKGL
jgi:hypothetical protein